MLIAVQKQSQEDGAVTAQKLAMQSDLLIRKKCTDPVGVIVHNISTINIGFNESNIDRVLSLNCNLRLFKFF